MKNSTIPRQLPNNSPLVQVFTKHNKRLHSGFITRLDRNPVHRKRISFFWSLIYNLAILVGSTALSTTFISHHIASDVPESLRLTLNITQGLLVLWAIYTLILTTSIPFFFGECRLRWKYGFRPTEVVIRRSPPESLSAQPAHHLPKKLWRASVHAIDPTLLYSNPASILASDFWVPEHAIVMDVYAGIQRGEINEEDLEFTAWMESGGVWTGLELWRLHNIVSDQQDVTLFKAFLSSSGKHELLSAWEKAFDHEKSSVTQTSAEYRSMVKRFSQEGIDYETAWSQLQRSVAV